MCNRADMKQIRFKAGCKKCMQNAAELAAQAFLVQQDIDADNKGHNAIDHSGEHSRNHGDRSA